MSDNAEAVLREIGEAFVNDGYPHHRLWSFTPSDETTALGCRELAARGYLERAPKGWRLSAAGADHVLAEHPMTSGALETLQRIRDAYVEAGYPNHRTWSRSPASAEEKPSFQELYCRGFIVPRGLGHKEWLLTDPGQQAIMKTV